MCKAVTLGRALALLLLAVLLTGCLDVDVAVDFKDANHGQLTERITVGGLSAGDSDILQDWALQVRRQVNPWGGTVRSGAESLAIAVPFYNTWSLEDRFNQLLALPGGTSSTVHLAATRDLNLIVSQRNRVSLDVDLRSLPPLDLGALQIRRIDRAVAGQLQVSAPNPITVLAASSPVAATAPNAVSWSIVPHQRNHLELVFWVPSPLGIGAVLLVAAVVAGLLLQPMFPL